MLGSSRWETSSDKRNHENDGACKLGALNCMVYQEYVVSYVVSSDHNYSLYNIDEGKFFLCDFKLLCLKSHTIISLIKASYSLWNK